MTDRKLTFAQAIWEATDQSMSRDPNVYIMGLGVPDPKGIFGTTLGFKEKYGSKRVLDMPASENGMTGVAIGSALTGLRPIMTHQRADFVLVAMDQIVNQAAKWHYMFAGKTSVPLVIRMIIGRGWGNGPQHSQNFQAMFAHIPGLRVIAPATPYEAKGLLISSIEDNNPVLFFEHRWLYNQCGCVPEEYYSLPLGTATILRPGNDITIIASMEMALQTLHIAEQLEKYKISAEIINICSLKPLDENSILQSVAKTGRVLIIDSSWSSFGVSAEIAAVIVEKGFDFLKKRIIRLGLPDAPAPTSKYPGRRSRPRASVGSPGPSTANREPYCKTG